MLVCKIKKSAMFHCACSSEVGVQLKRTSIDTKDINLSVIKKNLSECKNAYIGFPQKLLASSKQCP